MGTVTSASSVFSFAQQSGIVGDEKFEVGNYKWFKMRTPTIGVGPVEVVDMLPQEIGTMVPVGPFKTGAGYAGGIEMYPRMVNSLIILLEAAFGKRTSTPDVIYGGVARIGANLHKFTFDSSQTFLPWLGLRRRIPGATAAKVYGDVGYDCKVDSLSLRVPASGLLRGAVSFRGRIPKFPTPAEVNAWAYTNTFEDMTSIPLSSAANSKVLIAGQKKAITSLEISLINNLTSLQEEQCVGSPYADDFATKSRAMQIRIITKWSDGDLYKQVVAGGVNSVDWSAQPLVQDTVGSAKAFEATFNSPYNMPSVVTPTPYMFKIIANRLTWQLDRQGITLAGNNVIYVPFVATVLDPAAGEYVEVYVTNEKLDASYAWPVAPTLTIAQTPLAFTEGDAALKIDATATVTAVPATLLNGFVKCEVTGNGTVDDVLSIKSDAPGATAISLTGQNVIYNAKTIGVWAGGTAGTELVVTLTVEATPLIVTALLKNLQFVNASATPSTDQRTISVRVLDGAGGLAVATRLLNLTATP